MASIAYCLHSNIASCKIAVFLQARILGGIGDTFVIKAPITIGVIIHRGWLGESLIYGDSLIGLKTEGSRDLTVLKTSLTTTECCGFRQSMLVA